MKIILEDWRTKAALAKLRIGTVRFQIFWHLLHFRWLTFRGCSFRSYACVDFCCLRSRFLCVFPLALFVSSVIRCVVCSFISCFGVVSSVYVF